jgi:hypothetical protein
VKRTILVQYSWLQILADANVTYLEIDFENIFFGYQFSNFQQVSTLFVVQTVYRVSSDLYSWPQSLVRSPVSLQHGLSKFSLNQAVEP